MNNLSLLLNSSTLYVSFCLWLQPLWCHISITELSYDQYILQTNRWGCEIISRLLKSQAWKLHLDWTNESFPTNNWIFCKDCQGQTRQKSVSWHKNTIYGAINCKHCHLKNWNDHDISNFQDIELKFSRLILLHPFLISRKKYQNWT